MSTRFVTLLLITLISLTAFVPSTANAAIETHPSDSPDARLLRAEILELSRGDLDSAMAIYRSLSEDESAGEAIRAKALLQLARCHRKRGELEPARDLLERLVEKHLSQGEVIEQARGFLRELKAGRSDNPAFDWLESMMTSPEVQDRIFGHIMAMVSPNEAGDEAKKQLKALGGIVVPALEKFVRTTQDDLHREHLARLLVELEQFEYLATVFPGHGHSTKTGWVQEHVTWFLSLDDEKRSECHEALSRCTAAENREYALRLTRLAAKDYRFAQDDLTFIGRAAGRDGSRNESTAQRRARFALVELVKAIAEQRPAILANFVVDTSTPRDRRLDLAAGVVVAAMVRNDLPVSDAQLDRVWAGSWRDAGPYLENAGFHLRKKMDLDGMIRLGRRGDTIRSLVMSSKSPFSAREKARYLAAAEAFTELRRFAETHDEAIELFQRAVEQLPSKPIEERQELISVDRDEPWLGVQQRGNMRPSRSRSRSRTSPSSTTNEEKTNYWQPSDAYARALATWIQSNDPFVQSMGIEGIGRADRGIGPDVTDALCKIARNSDGDILLRLEAACALLRRGVGGWDKWDDAIAACEVCLVSVSARPTSALDESPLKFTSNLSEYYQSQGQARRLSPTRDNTLRSHIVGAIAASLPGHKQPALVDLLEHSLAKGDALELWLAQDGFRALGSDSAAELRSALIDALDSFTEPPTIKKAAICVAKNKTLRDAIERREERFPAKFVMAALVDSGIEFDVRLMLVGSLDSDQIDLSAIAPIFSADDPVVTLVAEQVHSRVAGSENRLEYARALIANPRTWTESLSLLEEGDDEFPAAVTAALKSGDTARVAKAADMANSGKTEVALPLLYTVLETGNMRQKTKAIERLVHLADQRSLKPLAARLDDPNFSIRNRALEALEKIESTLEKQRKWREGRRTQ